MKKNTFLKNEDCYDNCYFTLCSLFLMEERAIICMSTPKIARHRNIIITKVTACILMFMNSAIIGTF